MERFDESYATWLEDVENYGFEEGYMWVKYKSTGRYAIKRKGEVFFKYYNSLEEYHNPIKAIHIEMAKRPKGKAIAKVQPNGSTYEFKEDETNWYVYLKSSFNTKQGILTAPVQAFSKTRVGELEHCELDRLYHDELVRFNLGHIHNNFVTVSILDKIWELSKVTKS